MRGKCPQIHTCSVHFAGLTRHDGHSWPYGQCANTHRGSVGCPICPWESASASWPALFELSAPLIHSLEHMGSLQGLGGWEPCLSHPPVPPPFWQTSRGVQPPTYPTVTLRQRDSGTEILSTRDVSKLPAPSSWGSELMAVWRRHCFLRPLSPRPKGQSFCPFPRSLPGCSCRSHSLRSPGLPLATSKEHRQSFLLPKRGFPGCSAAGNANRNLVEVQGWAATCPSRIHPDPQH